MSVVVKQYVRMLDSLTDVSSFEDFARQMTSYVKFVDSLPDEEYQAIEGFHRDFMGLVDGSAFTMADEARMLVDNILQDNPDIKSSRGCRSSHRRRGSFLRVPLKSSLSDGDMEFVIDCLTDAEVLESEFEAAVSDIKRGRPRPGDIDHLLEMADSFISSYKDIVRVLTSEDGFYETPEFFRYFAAQVSDELRDPGPYSVEAINRRLRNFVSTLKYEME